MAASTSERLVATLQDNINQPNTQNLENYAYWVGGTDTMNGALGQYDLLRTGYGRLFILQMPKFVKYLLPSETRKFKHLLEFANTGISGIQGYTVDFTTATVGYGGNTVELPVNVKDETTSITIKLYEVQGSLIRTYIDFWITGTIDPFTGLSHYHGARVVTMSQQSGDSEVITSDHLYLSQANHTMEALYVATDPTGEKPEYVCLLTNMFPKGSDHSHFEWESGSHDLVQLNLEFTAAKYMSAQVNYIGNVALARYNILKNYLNMYSGYSKDDIMSRIAVPEITNWSTEYNSFDSYAPLSSVNTKGMDGLIRPAEKKNTPAPRSYLSQDV